MPQGVNFSKSPATWNEVLKTHARIYYTAKALGIEQQFIPAAFNTIQNEGRRLTGNTELEYFFKGFDVEREKYKSVSKSFGVTNAVDQADKRMKQWGITGVPVIIVNGKYRVGHSALVLVQRKTSKLCYFDFGTVLHTLCGGISQQRSQIDMNQLRIHSRSEYQGMNCNQHEN